MPTITIKPDYDGHVEFDGTAYTRDVTAETAQIGYDGKLLINYRALFRFPLTDLPANAQVEEAIFKLYCLSAGSMYHLLDIHPYNDDGQADPETDPDDVLYARCAPIGDPYINDSTNLQTLGYKSWTLPPISHTHIQQAKALVNRFTIACHEEGDDDGFATVYTVEREPWDPTQIPYLEITYTIPPPPVLGSRLRTLLKVGM